MALQVLFGVNQRLRVEDVDSPLVQIRPVKTVLLAVITGDRGLCGGYNNQVIKKVNVVMVTVKACMCQLQHQHVHRNTSCYSDSINQTYSLGWGTRCDCSIMHKHLCHPWSSSCPLSHAYSIWLSPPALCKLGWYQMSHSILTLAAQVEISDWG